MPALVERGYDDDGVYVWECSECDFGVAMRSHGTDWKLCPKCGVEFTHNASAYSQEARDVRYEREERKYALTRKRPGTRYVIRAYVSNEGRNYMGGWSRLLRSDLWAEWQSEWISIEDSPEPFELREWTNLTVAEARRTLKSLHGWPKWIEKE